MKRPRVPLMPVVVMVTALALVSCGDEGSVLRADATSTSGPATSEGAAASTTSTTGEAGGTTAATAAPTTIPATTAAPTSTTSSTTTSTTTTTTTTQPPDPLEFRADGLAIVDFGADPVDAIGIVRDHLGLSKTADSGWGPAWGNYGACPGTEYRQVEFEGLILQFTDADRFRPAGTRHFFAWSYDGTPAGIAPSGVTVGTTVAELEALYPTVEFAYDDLFYGDVFRVEGPVFGEQLWGMLTGPDPGDTITYLTGGIGCGE